MDEITINELADEVRRKKQNSVDPSISYQVYFEGQVRNLREIIETRLTELEQRIMQRFDLERRAVEKAEAQTMIRLEAMNEIKGMAADQAAHFLPRESHDARCTALMDVVTAKIDGLGKAVSATESKQSNFDGKMAIVIALAIVLSGFASAWLVKML